MYAIGVQNLKRTRATFVRTGSMIRRFLLSNESECLVFDVSPSLSDAVNPEFCLGWLCFEHPEERRRLAPIPKNWPELTESDLARLWERATPVTRIPLHDASGFLKLP